MLDWQIEVALTRYHERVHELEQRRVYDGAMARGSQLSQVRDRAMASVGGSLVLLGRRLQAKSGVVRGTGSSLMLVASQKIQDSDMCGQDGSRTA